MDKGTKPSGQTTTTTINPTQQAQLPFLQSGWQSAQNIYNANPMPSPQLNQAYQDIYNTGASLNDTLRPLTNATDITALTGGYGVQNSPAYPYFNQFATGTSAPQQTLEGYGAQAASGGLGLDELAKTASGAYVGQNPYAAAALQAAQDATTRGYQTATAPQTDANFAGAGRYGSGALLGARGQNEQNLGTTLANQSNQFYNTQYQQERALQEAAANQYQSLRNQGLGIGINATGQDLTSQQAGANALQSGYQSGNAAAISALQAAPNIQQLQFLPAQQQVAGATGLQNAPYDLLAREMSAFGQPTQGSGSVSQPYFQNSTANTLGALTGVAGLANALGGSGPLGLGASGGIGSLFGGGASVGSEAAAFADTAAATSPFALAAPEVGIADALSAVPAASTWIVCTELKRQGRMPSKHWAVGLPVFDAYPEIGKRGYYVWAIPSVRHLRRRPNSFYSRLLGTVFRWRAENIAASAGLRGARRLWRGRAVTVALAPICLVLGLLCGPQDWSAVYREEAAR